MTKARTTTLRHALTIAIPALALSACATPFNADVSRFQSQLPAPDGRTFYVTTDNPELQGGLEFSQYADLVEGEMQQLGYAQAASPDSADLIVTVDYEVDNGREKIRSTGFSRSFAYADPFSPWGFYGRRGYYGASRFAWGYYDPFFFGPGYSDIDSVTVYTSELDMKIDRRVDGQRLFEGTAEAMSRSDRLQYLVPNLVEAMFTDFPGNSGETVRISIAPEKTKVRRVD